MVSAGEVGPAGDVGPLVIPGGWEFKRGTGNAERGMNGKRQQRVARLRLRLRRGKRAGRGRVANGVPIRPRKRPKQS